MRRYNITLQNCETDTLVHFRGVDLDKVKTYLNDKWFDSEYKNVNSIKPAVLYRTNKRNKRMKR